MGNARENGTEAYGFQDPAVFVFFGSAGRRRRRRTRKTSAAKAKTNVGATTTTAMTTFREKILVLCVVIDEVGDAIDDCVVPGAVVATTVEMLSVSSSSLTVGRKQFQKYVC